MNSMANAVRNYGAIIQPLNKRPYRLHVHAYDLADALTVIREQAARERGYIAWYGPWSKAPVLDEHGEIGGSDKRRDEANQPG